MANLTQDKLDRCGYNYGNKPEKPVSSDLISYKIRDLPARGISKATCEKFDYGVSTYTGYVGKTLVRDEPVHVANVANHKGTKLAQQLRTQDKDFVFLGQGKALPLAYMNLWTPNDQQFVTIVEGYIDALSVYEALGEQYPVVSVPMGVLSAAGAISKSLEWLQKFKHVVLAFDTDEVGQAGMLDCIELFEPGKVRVAKWSEHDANAMLLKGKFDGIKSALWKAEVIRPDKICTPLELTERVLNRPQKGTDWPWPNLTDVTLGMRENQLIIVGAAPGIGKTEMVKDIILDISKDKAIKTALFSFEQAPEETLTRLVGGIVNRPLHIPGQWWDEEEITSALGELDGKVFLYDSWGGVSADELVKKIRYLVKAEGIKLVVIDHLTAIAAKMEGDERRGIDRAMELLASLTRELKICMILVAHLSRDKRQGANQEDSWGSGRRPALENFRGSGAIEAWADVVLGLSRNADSEDPIEQSLLTVECLKARLNGKKRGKTFTLVYKDRLGKLVDPAAQLEEQTNERLERSV